MVFFMNASEPEFQQVQRRTVDLFLRLGTVFVLLFWCFTIVQPFILIIVWGIIVAIALAPLFRKLSTMLGGRQKLTAAVISLVLIAILVVPAIMLTDSMISGAGYLAAAGQPGEMLIPPPPESVATWPLIGNEVFAFWQEAAENLPKLLDKYTPQIASLGTWLLQTVTGTGLGILQFIISFIIAGVLLATAETGVHAAEALATRLAGNRGPEFAALATGTVRNVAVGIIGVSMVQTALLSAGFLAIDLPGAGLAAFLVLVFCIVQIGPGLVAVPAVIYVFSTADTTPAMLFFVWTFIMSIIDSVLKPLVFGRGAKVPTLVIFLGAIGGMLAYGIIGLFLGAVVLSLGYKLYEAWLANTSSLEVASDTPEQAKSTLPE
jgi:predicted PurR-regulated permease PerM